MNDGQFPVYRGRLVYKCLNCNAIFPSTRLFYSCPDCNGILLLIDEKFEELKKVSGEQWQKIFDARQGTHLPSLRGVFRFYELIAPIVDEEDIVYLGEANTPVVEAAVRLKKETGISFAFKNDGQNPTASFKDRGMACAFSYLKWLCRKNGWKEVLTICASTGDTSAAAALYAAYVGPPLKSVVLLPAGKVTPQQLSQPLGSGAIVLEMPGVFDDCMKVVEYLSEHYRVALLNSKNSWRILGQESWAYETAQWFGWRMQDKCIFVPIGNAGNITAIMNGFLKLYALHIIDELPRIFGVQSSHADPVFRYYDQPENSRQWKPVKVRPSVAQAAMIGNPVSFPRVKYLAEQYVKIAGSDGFQVIQVSEQEIIEAMLEANQHGHIACTQGGECFAGLKRALRLGKIASHEHAILNSTAHILKFAGFQEKYFQNQFEPEYEINPDTRLRNMPRLLVDKDETSAVNTSREYAKKIAEMLELQHK